MQVNGERKGCYRPCPLITITIWAGAELVKNRGRTVTSAQGSSDIDMMNLCGKTFSRSKKWGAIVPAGAIVHDWDVGEAAIWRTGVVLDSRQTLVWTGRGRG